VASVFGAIFAPRPEVMIAELFRVVRPGNTVALTAWGDYGVQAKIFERFDRFRPMPAGVPKPSLWGDEDVVQERLAPYANTIRAERVTIPVSFDSAEELWRAFSNNGPLVALGRAIPAEDFDALGQEVKDVVAPYVDSDGRVHADAEYLRIVARKRG
jgi:hypothetical protein